MGASKPRILAQQAAAAFRGGRRAVARAFAAAAPGYWLAFAVMSLTGAAAFGLAPGTTLETVPVHAIERELPVPAIAVTAEAPAQRFWQRARIDRGDTLGSVLSRAGVDDPDAMQFLRTNAAARALYQLRPGKSIAVRTDEAGALLGLRFLANDGTLLAIARDGDAFSASAAPATADVRWEMATGEIRTSLFGAADAAGLPDAITMQLADVFAGDIDFYKDIKRGDRFAVVYEVRDLDGEPIGAGRIVAARFENRGRTLEAYLWRDAGGNDGYYTSAGVPLQRAFLRSPLAFSRVTSGFSLARFHPILNIWRAHKGVDYAAPIGTPVRATANGTVLFAGRQEGYGNVIHLQQPGPVLDAVRAPVGLREGDEGRRARDARRGDRLRRPDRLGDRTASALRIPRRRTSSAIRLPSRCPPRSRCRRRCAQRSGRDRARRKRARADQPRSRVLRQRRLTPAPVCPFHPCNASSTRA